MSSPRKIQPDTATVKPVKKTALDYVLPYNHLPVPRALDYAMLDYFNQRTYGVMELARADGHSLEEIAKKMRVSIPIVWTIIDKFGGSK